MHEYEVSLDFHDNAIATPPRVFTSLADLARYLETVPGKVGFEMTGEVTVGIKTHVKNPTVEQLLLQTHI